MLRLASNHQKLKSITEVFFPRYIMGSAILSTPDVGLQPPGLGEKTFLLIEIIILWYYVMAALGPNTDPRGHAHGKGNARFPP